MKLNIGLLAYSSAWEQLLVGEGVPFSDASIEELSVEQQSVVIVNRAPASDERMAIEKYLSSGGAVLGSARNLDGVCQATSRKEQIDFLIADNDEVFSSVQLLDLAIVGDVPCEANCLRTQQQTFGAFAGALGGGYAVILPFDIGSMMSDDRVASKNFYSTRERLPSERVSLVSKGELQHLLHDALQYLHHARNMPYAHLWYYPDGKKNCFAFRIDSDKGSRKEIDELYEVAHSCDINMTWFLDAKSHEEWLHHFAFLSGQEFGVHCYEHQTYDTFDANVKNVAKAKHKLDQAGISSSGFSAPFGIWNPALAEAIDHVGFEYSSEFSFAYDALPFFPSTRVKKFNSLQIPIHPICIGSLRKVGYTESQMMEYFHFVIDAKLLRDEPLFFYHHPTHHCWEVMRYIFDYVKEKGIDNVTMIEYERWWKKRLATRVAISFDDGECKVQSEKSVDDTVWLRIIEPSKREALMPINESIDLSALQWRGKQTAVRPSDIRRMREFDARGMMGDLFTTLTRKLSSARSPLDERKTDE